jgi:hydrogenase maturation factor
MSRLPAGKLPQQLLAELLARVVHRDPRVLVGPGIGRDAAVIDTGGPRLLIAKTDPITFATDLIGWYAVHVNANDIACMGGRPAWFLATALLPEGCSPDLPREIFGQIAEACAALGVELVGGHTEITYRLDRPLIAGAMLGEVDRDRLVRPETARPGDAVILTKGIAIEGTGVLAREAAGDLRAAGVSANTVKRAAGYITDPGISIVTEAGAACDAARVHAMHDPTEGGLATALRELAEATGRGIRIEGEAIVVLPETAAVCDALGLDAMGLLASGALLIAADESECARVIASIEERGVAARKIGSLVEASEGAIITVNGEPMPLPSFDRDEVARFLSERASRQSL